MKNWDKKANSSHRRVHVRSCLCLCILFQWQCDCVCCCVVCLSSFLVQCTGRNSRIKLGVNISCLTISYKVRFGSIHSPVSVSFFSFFSTNRKIEHCLNRYTIRLHMVWTWKMKIVFLFNFKEYVIRKRAIKNNCVYLTVF